LVLEKISGPDDLKRLSYEELERLAQEIRATIVETVLKNGGHLGSNLGAVELTLALHRVFDSPKDAILFDTGHQAYAHKLVTGRAAAFGTLRKEGGLSGYPNRGESPHDWVENSHASTVLSYAQGLATAFARELKDGNGDLRRVVAVIGDGALTGGMAYEALNNIGHSGCPVIVVLNDNGRSYAPTISRLSVALTALRLHPSYLHIRDTLKKVIREIPAVGELAYSSIHGIKEGIREMVQPHVFFEALGVRYVGPIDGHDIRALEATLSRAKNHLGPVVVHVITEKGKGYEPAEKDEVQRLHDFKVRREADDSPPEMVSYTEAFSRALLEEAARDDRIVAVTAAMPGPTGLLPFQERYPHRFFDVGIAEQHAVTMAAGMAMGGLRPVVAIYSTFLCRAFDQMNLDVGLHQLPVVFVADRAGVTGDDGPSHHGLLDMVMALAIPGMVVTAPYTAADVPVMLRECLKLEVPCLIRFPKTPPPVFNEAGQGMESRWLIERDSGVVLIGIGKMVGVCLEAAKILENEGILASVVDARVVRPPDLEMLKRASARPLVVTVEDGHVRGGAGQYLAMACSEHFPEGGARWLHLGVPVQFLAHGSPEAVLRRVGLSASSVAERVKQACANVLS
jgi:1-deoxy-D-xylulose-5-phosphate synthase